MNKQERAGEAYIKDIYFLFILAIEGYSVLGVNMYAAWGGREGRWNNSPKTECGLHL